MSDAERRYVLLEELLQDGVTEDEVLYRERPLEDRLRRLQHGYEHDAYEAIQHRLQVKQRNNSTLIEDRGTGFKRRISVPDDVTQSERKRIIEQYVESTPQQVLETLTERCLR